MLIKGRIAVGCNNEVIEKGVVVIDNNKISKVYTEEEYCLAKATIQDTEVYSVDGGTIMPGMVEAHTHLSWGSASAIDWITSTPQLSMALALRDLAYLREQGYTSVRDMGSDVVFLKEVAAKGLIDVPRICASGKILTQIGGHADVYQKLSLEASKKVYGPAFIVNGVDEVREACRKNARNGAEFIKIMTSGGVFSQGDQSGKPHSHFSADEIRAAVEEAENMGGYVASHAQANRGIKTALKNGVKSIEHGFYLDEECLELMVKNDCTLVPTLSIMHTSMLYFQNNPATLAYLKEKTMESYEQHYKSLEMARKAHIRIGMGCDFLSDEKFGCTYDKATMEIERLSFAGFTPLEIIEIATKNGAHLIMREDTLGTIREGNLADLILVGGNPTKDIRVLCDKNNIKLVVQDGRIVKNIMGNK